MKITKLLNEGISSVLYYSESISDAINTLKTDKFSLFMAAGTDTETDLTDDLYFFSTTRSKIGGFHLNPYKNAMIFKLDGDKLRQRYKGRPVDYWGPFWRSMPDKDEMEDRIFSSKPFIPNATSYILEMHIYVADEQRDDDIAKALGSNVRKLMILGKKNDIPTYLYNDVNAWHSQNKAKAISATEFIKSSRHKPSKYFPRTKRLKSYLKPYLELYYSSSRDDLSKAARDLVYYLVYHNKREFVIQLKNTIHNNRTDAGITDAIAKIFRKERIKSVEEYADLMKTKWTEIYEKDRSE